MHLYFKVDKKKRKRGLHTKKRRHAMHHLREYLWPTIGIQALLRFIEIRIKRGKGTASGIAYGLASGVFVSFTPFIGLHAFLAIILSVPFGGSWWAALLGTLVGNPWTFPFIWVWSYKLGHFILGETNPVPFPETFNFQSIVENLDFYMNQYIWPMVVGGIPTGILAGLGVYLAFYWNIKIYREKRKAFLKERRSRWKVLKHTTGILAGKFVQGFDVLAQVKQSRGDDKEESNPHQNNKESSQK